jgi:DNA-binding phage protein
VVVVRTREQLYQLVQGGYKPYFHRAVRRWYLRKGRERILVDRSLEADAEAIARAISPQREVSEERVIEAVEMRARDLPVSTVVEEKGVAKSTLYRKLGEYEEAVRKIESLMKELGVSAVVKQVEPPHPPPPPTQPVKRGQQLAGQAPTTSGAVQSHPQEPGIPNVLADLQQWSSSIRQLLSVLRIDPAKIFENPERAVRFFNDIVRRIFDGGIIVGSSIAAVIAKLSGNEELAKVFFTIFDESYKRYHQQISQEEVRDDNKGPENT